jgi:hypothetical protein
MQFRLIALAAAAAVSSSAFALTPTDIANDRTAGTLKEVVLHGSSAQSNLVAGYIGSKCKPGTLDTYQNVGGSGTGKDYKAYACLLASTVPGTGGWVANTPILVIKRDAGGSIYGVNPIARQWQENTMVVDASCTSAGTNLYNCPNVAPRQAIAGLSDVEPALFNKTITNGTTAGVWFNLPNGALANDDNGNAWAPGLTTAEINGMDSAVSNETIFAVAVNGDLRNALQAAQGLTVGSTAAADMPSMPRAFYTAAAAGFVKAGDAKLPGWDAVTGVPADNSKPVNVCRRANGSGTQATSNLFFLEAGNITTTVGGALYPLEGNATAVNQNAALNVIENSATGNAVSCISGTPAGSYSMGIISYENIPSGNWSFVKLDGQAPSQAAARVGAYPYLYSATMQWKKAAPGNPDAGTKAFLIDMRKKLGTPANIAALTSAAAKQGVLAPPSGYTGSCASQTPGSVNALYGSCVERLDFASIYNDGVVFYGLAATAAYKTNSLQQLHIVK